MNAGLPLYPAGSPLLLDTPESGSEMRFEPSAPATSVMTEFSVHAALAVSSSRLIDEALSDMQQAGVRALFVTDGVGRMAGFITSYDIQGESPIRFLQGTDCLQSSCARSAIVVGDIMTRLHNLRVLDSHDVLRATVRDVAETFKTTGVTHLVVMEKHQGSGEMYVRGLFSRSRLERATGLKIEAVCVARDFRDAEQALTEHDCSC